MMEWIDANVSATYLCVALLAVSALLWLTRRER